MRIIRRGPKSKEEVETYRFRCHSCMSVLQAKSYELRRFGFKNNYDEPNPGYVFMCPVCNCQRVVRSSEMEKIVPINKVLGSKVDELLTKAVKKLEKEGKAIPT